MACCTSLNVIVRECKPIFQLIACKDQPLLVRWNALQVLDLVFEIIYCPIRFDTAFYIFSHERLNSEPHFPHMRKRASQRDLHELHLTSADICDLFLGNKGRLSMQDLVAN